MSALAAGFAAIGCISRAAASAEVTLQDASRAGTTVRRRFVALILIGLVAGAFSALFGVGGGIVVVPLLIAMLGMDAKVATATSLAAIVLTSLVGATTHSVLGNVDVARAAAIGLPAMLGVHVGVRLKERVTSRGLTIGFAVLVALVALRLFFPGGSSLDLSSRALEGAIVGGTGFIAGVIAALFGVGGGVLFVPLLVLVLGLSQIRATGTSLLAMLPVSLLGTWRQRSNGTIVWRDAVVLGLASTTTAVVGALAADVAPGGVLRRAFAIVLLATAIQLAVRVRGERR